LVSERLPDDYPLLLDVTRLIWRRWRGRLPTGIDRVCLAYLRHFGPRAQAVIQHDRFRRILDREASQDLFSLMEGSPSRFRLGILTGFIRHLRGLDSEGRSRIYLNVGHTGLNSAGFNDWVVRSNVRPVYLVHDLIPISHPQFCRPREAERHRDRMLNILATAAGVIGNSRATLDELAQFAASEDLPMPSSHAAWLGVDPPPPAAPALTNRPTFVTLGTIEGRKNHRLLLEVWQRLIDRMGNDAPQLLIIGQRGWEAEPVFEMLDRCEKLRGHVTELSCCSDQELAGHLASARALLFPSLAEGFGLPLVEALTSGVPAIASNLPVFSEICGEIPTYLSASDDAAWEQAILNFAASESAQRSAQLERMKGFVPPTWQAHFESIEPWLQTLG
jgi:glycosyltransferase involved in cell wall biosynthesis